MLGEERRKNQILVGSNTLLEAKNRVLEARLEELQRELSVLDRPSPTVNAISGHDATDSAAATVAKGGGGWLFGLWGTSAAPEAQTNAESSKPVPDPEDSETDLDAQQLLDELKDVVTELSQTKVELAEVKENLTGALRDVRRLQGVNDALNAHIDKLTAEGWTPNGSDVLSRSSVASGRRHSRHFSSDSRSPQRGFPVPDDRPR
jgi:hypothetical protein